MSVDQSLMNDLEQAILVSSTARRAASLQHVVNLFVARAADFSEAQVGLFDVVIMRLVETIETEVRAKLANQLAPIPNAPPRIIHTLAFDDEIDVARPVLMQSERLDEAALVRNAATKGQGHLLAIAQRKTISPSVTDVLVQRGDSIVVARTAENKGAKFSDNGYAGLIQRSADSEQLALIVGTRPELPRHQFLKLLTIASGAVRTRLERENPQAVGEIRRVVREVEMNIESRTAAKSHDYSEALEIVEQLSRDGELHEHSVFSLAADGKFEQTVVALSLFAEVPIAVVERALTGDRPELLLMLLKAMKFNWATVKAIIGLRELQKPREPFDLEQCLASYERIKLTTAQQAVRYHRGER
jgi:uncharacterized protein (DUF2336 family)